MEFWFCFFILGAPIGGFIGMMIATLTGTKWWVKLIIILIFMAIFGFLCGKGMYMEKQSDTILWNDGYHACGGKWRLVDVVVYRGGHRSFYYECNDCFAVIQTSIGH